MILPMPVDKNTIPAVILTLETSCNTLKHQPRCLKKEHASTLILQSTMSTTRTSKNKDSLLVKPNGSREHAKWL